MEQVPALARDPRVGAAASLHQTSPIPHRPCSSSGPRRLICRALRGERHTRRHCRHPPKPPWGCAWAPGCCGCCRSASTSCSAAGASANCWTRELPPRDVTGPTGTPCLPLHHGTACQPVLRELTDPQRWDPSPACAPPPR